MLSPKTRHVLTAAVALVAVTVAATASASPSTPMHVAGAFALTHVPTGPCTKSSTQAGVMVCRQRGGTIRWTGSLRGATVSSFTGMLDCKTGATWGSGTERFTGSVAGVGSGTLVLDLHYSSAVDCQSGGLQSFTATDVIVSGTGALAKLRGSLYRVGDDTYAGTFS